MINVSEDLLNDPDFVEPFEVRRTLSGLANEGEQTTRKLPPISAVGSVQPVGQGELSRMDPEGLRKRAVIRVYTIYPLQGPSGDGNPGDIIQFCGHSYRVFQCQPWYDYVKAYAEEVE